MTDDQQARLTIVEQKVAEIREKQVEMQAEIKANAEVTNAVKADTSEIVSLIKGANVLARVAKWLTIVVGGYLAGKGLKWW